MWKEHVSKFVIGVVSVVFGFAIGRRSGKKSSSKLE